MWEQSIAPRSQGRQLAPQNTLFWHFHMTCLFSIRPHLFAGRLDNFGYLMRIHSDLFVGRFEDVASNEVLSHTSQGVLFTAKSPIFWGSGFVAQDLPTNNICAT